MILPDSTLLSSLLKTPSITPKDAGCIPFIVDFLGSHATVQHLNMGSTSNCYIEVGQDGPLLLFVGHTDVVTSGPESLWQSPPFSGNVNEPMIIGRGIVDMKGAIWAFSSALKSCITQLNGRVGLLLTSDEEGDGKQGIASIIPHLQSQGIYAQWAIVGEPTSLEKLGDHYKHQRRGSDHIYATITGQQGHTAYPEQAKNPSNQLIALLAEIESTKQSILSPDDSLEIYSINTSSHVSNMIPASITIRINLRYQHQDLAHKIIDRLKAYAHIEYIPGAKPYQSNPIQIKEALTQAILKHTGIQSSHYPIGGTSDARHLAPIAKEIIEFGLSAHSAHQTNEHCSSQDLHALRSIYLELIYSLIIKKPGTHIKSAYNKTERILV